MTRLAIVQYDVVDIPRRRHRTLSVFVQRQNINAEQLDGALAPILSRGVLFEHVHFVGADEVVASTSALLGGPSAVRERLDRAVPNASSATLLMTFDATTGAHVARSLDGTTVNAGIIAIERQYFLAQIFQKSGGLVSAPSGIHYVKPSQKHANAFLRAANVFENGAHVQALAFWLLPYLAGYETEYIFVDTSGIAAVALAAGYEAVRIGLIPRAPLVESHNSYSGLVGLQVERLCQVAGGCDAIYG